ncbi:MAG: HIT family protein [Candidatus Buchananbacteria bacterium]|nr:HIT family protein [Candidatus Buchananbacteria bacterium]
MPQDCIFCKIAVGDIPSATIYEDDKIKVFLDINPVTKGHSLIIPKAHYQMMADTPSDLLAHVFSKAQELMVVIKEALEADFVALSVVGVDVPHFHVHLIPRRHDDGLSNWWPTGKYDKGEMEQYVQKIKQAF